MTTTTQVINLFVTALQGATNAGSSVFCARDVPTWNGNYPMVYVRAPKERREGLGPNGAPQFLVTSLITIEATVELPADQTGSPFDQAAAALQAELSVLDSQIGAAIINNPVMMGPIGPLQEFVSVEVEQHFTSQGEQHLGTLVFTLAVRFYMGPEDFYPVQTSAIEQITTTMDAQNVFDATGTYANPAFPASVRPAPRTQGPDGRAEGYTVINFNQE